jgi:acyl dehydratase
VSPDQPVGAGGGSSSGIAFGDVNVGDQIQERAFPLSRTDLVRYAGASGDLNPIHWSDRTASGVGLPGVIAHGMLTMATAVRLVTDWVGDPGAVLEYGVRFANPVPVDEATGAVLRVNAVVATKDEATRSVRVDLSVTLDAPVAGGGPAAGGAVAGRAVAGGVAAGPVVAVLARARAVVRLG